MTELKQFLTYSMPRRKLKFILGGYISDYDICRSTCYGDMTVGCDKLHPVTFEDEAFDSCMASGYKWCDGYCGSGI